MEKLDLSQKELNSVSGGVTYDTAVATCPHCSNKNSFYNFLQSSQKVACHKYKYYLKCDKCNHEWTEES